MNVAELLFEKQDLKYRDFTAKLIPTVPKDRIIGVRTPDVRAILKRLLKDKDFMLEKEAFLKQLPHKYHEENALHSGLIASEKDDIEKVFGLLEEFLPYVDNWAVCDCIAPKVFAKYPDAALERIKNWLKSDKTYTVRFGVVSLLQFYLDQNYDPQIFDLVQKVKSGKYYIDMALAWFYSFALIKRYDDAVKIIESKSLDKFVHNKSIQKAVESFRITPEKKEYLKALKK
jgi:3-methyladenine DNA glycosylase AlkD